MYNFRKIITVIRLTFCFKEHDELLNVIVIPFHSEIAECSANQTISLQIPVHGADWTYVQNRKFPNK